MAITKFEKAKAQIVLDYVFFNCLLMQYPIIERKDIPTLAVDKRGQIYYNAEFLESLPVPQIIWGLCHEIGHKIGNHAQRMHHRDPKKWNYAGDAWINDWLDADKVGERIPGCVDMPGSKDELVEDIYNKLPDSPSSSGGGGSNSPSPGGLGDDLLDEGEDLTPQEAAAADAQMKVSIVQAANVARMKGQMSAHMKRMVDTIVNVKTPWYDVLERFMVTKVKNESTWNRPNRRFIGQDLYLPSLDSIGSMGTVVIGVDTSGSIGDKELQCFGGHVNKIIETCRPEKVVVIYCDAKVNHVDEFSPEDYPVTFNAYGGGGTAFTPVFDYIAENGLDPAATIYFTDGYGSFPSEVSGPTIWAMTTDVVAPFSAGETIRFEVE